MDLIALKALFLQDFNRIEDHIAVSAEVELGIRIELAVFEIAGQSTLIIATVVAAGAKGKSGWVILRSVVGFRRMANSMNEPVIELRIGADHAAERGYSRTAGDEDKLAGCGSLCIQAKPAKRTMHLQQMTRFEFVKSRRKVPIFNLFDQYFEVVVVGSTVDRVLSALVVSVNAYRDMLTCFEIKTGLWKLY